MCDFAQTTATRFWGTPPNRSSPPMVTEKPTLPIKKATSMLLQNGQATSGNDGHINETIPGTLLRPKYSGELCMSINASTPADVRKSNGELSGDPRADSWIG